MALPLIVAHRGASADAPENTLAAFAEAWRQNADAIECDVRLTADGRLAVFHDAHLLTASGQKLPLAATPLAGLQAAGLAAHLGQPARGHRLAALAEVLATVPADKGIFIEIKSGAETVPPLLQTLRASRLRKAQISVISFHPEVIDALREHAPGLTRNLLVTLQTRGSRPEPATQAIIEALRRTAAHGLGISNHPTVDQAFAEAIQSAGFALHVWTVDAPPQARRYAALGLASITTNQPARTRRALQDSP